ncbi:MAG TPA: hypothetical protein VNQ97_13330 [Burkholderiaceae bacterium]|nr:hypothetical protein [Burkholderiaceae bacterium]
MAKASILIRSPATDAPTSVWIEFRESLNELPGGDEGVIRMKEKADYWIKRGPDVFDPDAEEISEDELVRLALQE